MTETIERAGTSTVTHIVTGTLDEVVTRMRELLTHYHPTGYGTRVDYLGPSPHPWSDKWCCRVKRAASCE